MLTWRHGNSFCDTITGSDTETKSHSSLLGSKLPTSRDIKYPEVKHVSLKKCFELSATFYFRLYSSTYMILHTTRGNKHFRTLR